MTKKQFPEYETLRQAIHYLRLLSRESAHMQPEIREAIIVGKAACEIVADFFVKKSRRAK